MKKFLLVPVLLALVFSGGCKKQLYHFVGTVPIIQEYEADKSNGAFSGTSIITKEDVTDVLNLPNNAQIEKVDLQNTGVTIEPLAGNAANRVLVSGTVTIGPNGVPLPLLNSFQVSTNSMYTLASMNQAGVKALTDQINAFLAPIPSNTSITIALTANSDPAGTKVHVKITMKIQCNVPSTACIEFPSFISEGEDCPEE